MTSLYLSKRLQQAYTPSPLVRKLNDQSGGRSFAFIYITNECQLNCTHCSFQSTVAKQHTRVDEEVILKAIDELRGIRDITLTGGEPTLHPSFKTILYKAAEKAKFVYLMTNGIELVGKDRLKYLFKREDKKVLVKVLKDFLESFPENIHFLFPLDSFHLKAFKPFRFLIEGLAILARQFNKTPERAFIGFISNEVSREKSQELIDKFKVVSSTHIGTALFAPWRKANRVKEWFLIHSLKRYLLLADYILIWLYNEICG